MEARSHPQLKADDDFRAICRKIVAERRTTVEWDSIESCDMFQQGAYVGGYDACEQAFTFSYYDPQKKEWWLTLSLPIAEKIASGDEYWIDLYEPIK
jgi:hypothetical protein